MKPKVLHKRSNNTISAGGALVPASSALSYGEIAINYKDGKETLFIKNDSDEVVAFESGKQVWEKGSSENSVQQKGTGAVASGSCAVAEGSDTVASGTNAHAEGQSTIASGTSSHAEGVGTQTTNNGEHAEGKYNKSNTNTISSVGIGTFGNSKNAFEIMQNGDVYIIGIGNYDGTNPASASTIQELIGDIETLLSQI